MTVAEEIKKSTVARPLGAYVDIAMTLMSREHKAGCILADVHI